MNAEAVSACILEAELEDTGAALAASLASRASETELAEDLAAVEACMSLIHSDRVTVVLCNPARGSAIWWQAIASRFREECTSQSAAMASLRSENTALATQAWYRGVVECGTAT